MARKPRIATKSGKITLYLYCKNKSSTGCVGKNTLVDGNLKDPNHNGHVCTPDPTIYDKLEAVQILKNMSSNRKLPPAAIVSQVVSEVSPKFFVEKVWGIICPQKKFWEIGQLKFFFGQTKSFGRKKFGEIFLWELAPSPTAPPLAVALFSL